MVKVESMSVVDSFQFHSGIGQAKASYYLKDRETGDTHTSRLRQIMTFRNMQIARMEVYHDRASLNAFLRMVEAPKSSIARSDKTSCV